MSLSFFLRGILIGLAIAAPVGPINVLCIRRTLADGRAIGFISGLGAAVADGTYGGVAAFGLTAVSGVLVSGQTWMRVIGGGFLLYLGVRTFIAKPAEPSEASRSTRLIGAFASTYVLTLTNPLTILFFAAIFAGLGIAASDGSYASAGSLTAGVFLGSTIWWVLLTTIVGSVRERFTPNVMVWVNRASGCLIGGFGVAAFVSLLI